MKLKHIVAASVLTLAAAGGLAGCGSHKAAAPPNTYRIMATDIIATADPSMNTDVIGAQALTDTMDGLYRYEGNTLKPAMTTKIVKPSADGLTYVFPLRKNAKWSNGDPVTAQDFVFAWRRTVDPKTKSQYAYIYEGINNAKDITAGKKDVTALGVKALDKHTLQVTLEKPIPYFDKLMTQPMFFPQNQKVVEKWGKKFGTHSKTLVSNGPYKLVNWNSPDNTWNEVKNSKYWNAKQVKVEKLHYQVVKDPSTALNLYQSKKLDRLKLTGDTSKQMKGSKDYEIQKQNSTFYLLPNIQKQELFKNQKIRQALSLAINRDQLTKKVIGNGTIAASSFTPNDMSFDPDNKSKDFVAETSATGKKYTRYDLPAAKKLWREGLAETGNTGKNFTFTLLGDDTDNAKQITEYVQNQLGKLPGLKITLNNVPFKNRLARSDSGDFDLVLGAWNADFADPINFLTLFTSDASYNYGKWSNPQYDAAVAKSLNEDVNNPSARWQDLKDAQNIANEQQGVIPLYQNGEAWLTNSRVKNLDYGPAGNYNNVSLRLKE